MIDFELLTAGNEEVFSEAVEEFSPELYRYAVGIVLSGADAEDAVQNAFISLWNHRGEIRDPSAVKAYLYRCTYHAGIDIIRRKRNFLPIVKHQEEMPLSDEMYKAMKKLSPLERAIVYERAVMETAYSELADRFVLREDSIRKKYERARKKLAKYLSEKESEAE